MREILTGHIHTRQREMNMATVTEFPHLKFSNLGHFKNALELAEKLGDETLKSFKDCFESLERICARSDESGEVHPDCVENSFYFRTYRRDSTLGLDGGIILHGLTATHSVELCPKKGVHWSMHT